MLHRFSKSLELERQQAASADSFYTKVLGARQVIRYASESAQDMAMQRLDIDVTIKVGERIFQISEKFRTRDFDDLYLEVYSKYPPILGWMDTGSPQVLVYFTPSKVHWIAHKELKDFYLLHLKPALDEKWFASLYNSNDSIVSHKLKLDSITTHIRIIQAHNFENKAWVTMGVGIDIDVLEKFGVKIRSFTRTTSFV